MNGTERSAKVSILASRNRRRLGIVSMTLKHRVVVTAFSPGHLFPWMISWFLLGFFFKAGFHSPETN